MEYSRQEYWTKLPFPAPKDLPNPGTESTFPASPTLAGRFFTTELPGKPIHYVFYTHTQTHTHIYIHTQCPQRVRGDTATMTQLKTKMFLFYNAIFKNQISRLLLEIKTYTTNSTPRYLPKRNKCSLKDLNMNVHNNCSIYNSQDGSNSSI